MRAPIRVIAGNYAEADDWARSGGLVEHRDWEYVSNAMNLRGLTSPPTIFAFVGTWHTRQDAQEMVNTVEACQS